MELALNDSRSGFGLDLEEKFNKNKGTGLGSSKPRSPAVDYLDDPPFVQKEELKTKKTYGLTKPSVFDKITRYAKEHGTSYNDIVNTLLEQFIDENGL